MQYFGSLEAAEKHISAKMFEENLHTSVKILQICMDLQDSVQRSLQNTAEKILQICTDSQRSKTWVVQLQYRFFPKQHVPTIFNKSLISVTSFCYLPFYKR